MVICIRRRRTMSTIYEMMHFALFIDISMTNNDLLSFQPKRHYRISYDAIAFFLLPGLNFNWLAITWKCHLVVTCVFILLLLCIQFSPSQNRLNMRQTETIKLFYREWKFSVIFAKFKFVAATPIRIYLWAWVHIKLICPTDLSISVDVFMNWYLRMYGRYDLNFI